MLLYYNPSFAGPPVQPSLLPIAVLLTVLTLPFGSACQAAAVPRVVVSIAPLHSLVAAVMEGSGTPQLLLRGGESPHTFSLRPSDARMLNNADLLFWIGPQLELPLARILPNLAVPRSVAMVDTPGLQLLPVRQLDERSPLHHSEGPVHERHARVDPHIWLSTANAAAMSVEIERILAHTDPARADLYRANAKRLRTRLALLDQELRQQLSRIDGGYAVFHDAYQYLEQQYGLQSAGTVTTHPERNPGAAHLHLLRRQLAEQRVRCLFSEPQFQARLVDMLSEGLPISHAVLDPLGADIPPGPGAYPQLMRSMAQTFVECMQGETPR